MRIFREKMQRNFEKKEKFVKKNIDIMQKKTGKFRKKCRSFQLTFQTASYIV